MRVALIHYRLLHKGGLETRLLNYIDYFLKRGDEVTVICTKKAEDFTVPEGLNVKLVKLGLMPKLFRKVYFNHKLAKVMAEEKFDFSLSLERTSHQQMVLAPSNHLGYLAALGRKARGFDDRNQIYLDTEAYKRSRAVFAASGMLRDEVINLHGIEPEKVSVLYPPLNTKVFNQSKRTQRQALRQKFNMEEDKKYFAFVSVSHKRKGLEILKEVFGQLPEDHVLLVAGDKTNSSLRNIRHVGHLLNPEELYIAADYTIHPALYEPFGQIVSESLGCGTPVLVSHKVGAKEIVGPDEGLVVNSLAPEDWLKAILSLKETQFNISPNFVEEKQLSLEAHMAKMLEVWEKQIANKNGNET